MANRFDLVLSALPAFILIVCWAAEPVPNSAIFTPWIAEENKATARIEGQDPRRVLLAFPLLRLFSYVHRGGGEGGKLTCVGFCVKRKRGHMGK
jgi:hypothetical protein